MDVSKNSGFTPQIIHFNRVFHYFHPSILGGTVPLFLVQHPYKISSKWPHSWPRGLSTSHSFVQQMAAFLAWGLTTSQKKRPDPHLKRAPVFGNESTVETCCPKNHGISNLVVCRSQNPAIQIQTPL